MLPSLARYIRDDYVRWNDFEKSIRLIQSFAQWRHRTDADLRRHPLCIQIRQRPSEQSGGWKADGRCLWRPRGCRHGLSVVAQRADDFDRSSLRPRLPRSRLRDGTRHGAKSMALDRLRGAKRVPGGSRSSRSRASGKSGHLDIGDAATDRVNRESKRNAGTRVGEVRIDPRSGAWRRYCDDPLRRMQEQCDHTHAGHDQIEPGMATSTRSAAIARERPSCIPKRSALPGWSWSTRPQTRIEGEIQQMAPDFPVIELWRVPGRPRASSYQR